MKYLFLVAMLILVVYLPAEAARAVLTWEYKDDPKVKIDGFRIYWGELSKKNAKKPDNPANETDPKPYQKVMRIADPKSRRVTIEALDYGKYYFRIITTTAAGSTSVFSNEAFGDIKPLPAPTNVEIILTITP